MRRIFRVEYAHERKIRQRNKTYYRFAHWPIWIWVFFLAPGRWTFQLFAHGFSRRHWLWLAIVLLGTAAAGLAGQLPGVEPRPYILRFCEDKPNPVYRRICYTFAWNALLNFACLNLAGLIVAAARERWILPEIYSYAYYPMLAAIIIAGIVGYLPRVRRSTKGEGTERRYFYGAVWAVSLAQTILFLLWKSVPLTQAGNIIKLIAFVAVLVGVGASAAYGLLPRTRPILPGELMVAD